MRDVCERDSPRGCNRSHASSGLPGDLVDIDALDYPYDDAHRMQTSVPADNAHGMIAVDPYTPYDGDQPHYRDVWCALIGP